MLEQQLPEHNTMVVKLTHDNRALNHLFKKILALTGKKDAVIYLVNEEKVAITRACAHLWLAKSSYYVRLSSRTKGVEPVIKALNQAVTKNSPGVVDYVLIGCAIRIMSGISIGYSEFTGQRA